MDNLFFWLAIWVVSLILGLLHYYSGYYEDINKHNKPFKLMEFFRCFINYFLTLTIVYYFISVRWVYAAQGNLSLTDFILFIVFVIGIFGWLPYFVKNITEGITVIFKKFLN